MKSKMLISLSLILLISIIIISQSQFLSTSILIQNNNISYLKIKVVDTQLNEAIDNATICVLETNEYFYTDKNGYADLVIHESYLSNYSKVLNAYLINLLVFKNGYNEHIFVNHKIKTNSKTVGLTIPLLQIKNESDNDPYITYEHIPNDLVDDIIIKYKK